MKFIKEYIFIWIFYLAGQFPIHYNKKTEQFTNSKCLRVYSIIQAIINTYLSFYSTFAIINDYSPMTITKLYMIIIASTINIACIFTLGYRIFAKHDLHIFQKLHEIYFKKSIKFHCETLNNSKNGIIPIVIFFGLIPFTFIILDVTVLVFANIPQLSKSISLISVLFLWIISLNFPVLISNQILQNTLKNCSLMFENVATESKYKFPDLRMKLLFVDIEELAKLHYSISILIKSVMKMHSLNYLLTCFTIFLNFIYNSYFLIHYLCTELLVLNQFEFYHFLPWVINIFYYGFFIVIFIRSSSQLVTENENLIKSLQRIDMSYFNDDLKMSVRI